MTLTGSGAIFLPSALLKTMGEAIADIGNGGLETAQIIGWASGQKQPAVAAPIPAHKERVSTVVEVPGGEPVSPEATATARTAIWFGPGKTSTEFKDALDGGFDEKYQ
jgi:hypothetical protein